MKMSGFIRFLLFRGSFALTVIPLVTQVMTKTNADQVAEKVYIHTDKAYYLPGDDIWFKAYVIDPATNCLSMNTHNLHVELLSAKPEIIQNRILRIENGTGKGDFHLSASQNPGRYMIRAYTNHMRNYDSEFFFRKKIVVLKSLSAETESDSPNSQESDDFMIDFFPEGGMLVENVISRVAFKAVNKFGKGCNVSGSVFSTSGDSITSFKASRQGMGSFIFRPKPGESYFAVISEVSGSAKKVFLPPVSAKGIRLSASFEKEETLLVTIRTNGKTEASLYNKSLNLILSSRNLIVRTVKIRINSTVSHFEVPFKEFPPGLIRLTLTDDTGHPISERLIFYRGENDVQLKISTDRNEYKPGEKVQLFMSLSCDSGMVESGNFSLSAAGYMYSDSNLSNPAAITSWFLLESDIRGPVEEPYYYFDPYNKDRKDHLDLLLMTTECRDFIWKYDSAFYFRNENGFNISGKIMRNDQENKYVASTVTMGIFGSNTSDLYYTETDSAGGFRFENIDLIGDNRVLLSADNSKYTGKLGISVDPPDYVPAEIDKEEVLVLHQGLRQTEYNLPADKSGPRDSENKFRMFRSSLTKNKSESDIMVVSRQVDGISNQNLASAAMILRGYDEPRIFTAPKYRSTERKKHISSIGKTLFWEPDITIRSDSVSSIVFVNTGTSGVISIIAEGITESGIPVTGKVSYSVK